LAFVVLTSGLFAPIQSSKSTRHIRQRAGYERWEMNMMMRHDLQKALWATVLSVMLASVFSVVWVAPGYAQTMSITQIAVKGNQRIEAATIRNYAGLDLKNPVTAGQINAAYQRLIDTGLFEEVSVEPAGNTLVVTVKEYPTINRIDFEGNKKLKDEKLAGVIQSKSRRTYSPKEAQQDAALITEAYRQAGRYTAEVTPKIIRRSDNRVDLVFEIFEGGTVEVERLSFVGNRYFSDRRLRRVLLTKQAGILRRFIRSDTFAADRIAFDRQVLTDFYHSEGFIDFQVLGVSSEVVRERNGFFLTFKVQEGQSYKFGKITTTSALKDLNAEDYAKVVTVKSGGTYSPALVERSVDRIEGLATQNGLNFIRATPKVTRNEKTLTLDIEFVVERGPRVFVERIDIEGNDTTLDRVIRRQFTTVEGDPFNPRAIRAASDRIKALGFFSQSEVTTRPGSTPDRVIVDVNVKDQPTGSLSFGASYGSSGLGATISLSESNFLGRGQSIGIQYGGATTSSDYSLSFSEPALLDGPMRFSFEMYQRNTNAQNAFYDTVKAALSPSISFPISENGRVSFGYLAGSNTVLGVTGTPSPIVTADVGTITNSSLTFGYTFDNRKNGLRQNSGTIFRVNQEIAGFGGQAQYSKSSVLLGGRVASANDKLTFSVELEGGLLVDNSGASTITNRFFMGDDIMRGFKINGIGPRDLSVANRDALGGNMYAVARFETTFPLGLPEEYGVNGGLFFDVGSVWGLDATTLALSPTVDAGMHIRSMIGFSVFLNTAIGPLRFNFSQPIATQSYDQVQPFNLTIGKRF